LTNSKWTLLTIIAGIISTPLFASLEIQVRGGDGVSYEIKCRNSAGDLPVYKGVKNGFHLLGTTLYPYECEVLKQGKGNLNVFFNRVSAGRVLQTNEVPLPSEVFSKVIHFSNSKVEKQNPNRPFFNPLPNEQQKWQYEMDQSGENRRNRK